MVCLKSQYGVPVYELLDGLNPVGFNKGSFVALRGYIDESGNQHIFTLSSLIADGENWFYLEQDWIACLEKKNQSLAAAGRRQITRYHASDCSSCVNEFAGWSRDEQIEFVGSLISIFNRYRMDTISYSINLPELVEEIPMTASNPRGFAYTYLLLWIMLELGDSTLARNPSEVISMFHDHCDYDAALIEAFNLMIDDENFRFRHRFVSLTPERWEHCIPLQPADLIAYENFKEAERQSANRDRRKSLKLILADGRIGGSAFYFNKDNLRKLNRLFAEMDAPVKDALLSAARIHKETAKNEK